MSEVADKIAGWRRTIMLETRTVNKSSLCSQTPHVSVWQWFDSMWPSIINSSSIIQTRLYLQVKLWLISSLAESFQCSTWENYSVGDGRKRRPNDFHLPTCRLWSASSTQPSNNHCAIASNWVLAALLSSLQWKLIELQCLSARVKYPHRAAPVEDNFLVEERWMSTTTAAAGASRTLAGMCAAFDRKSQVALIDISCRVTLVEFQPDLSVWH